MMTESFFKFTSKVKRTLDMQTGDFLFRQDQPTSGFYRVISGAVTLRRTSLGGETLTLHSAVSGGYFAEASLFSDRYHCLAVCTKAGQVLKFAKDDVMATMQTDPAFSNGFARHLATQVQAYRAHIELLAIRSANERVMAAIQAGYFDASVPALAARINLTHEACYRALRSLCDERRLDRIGRGQYKLRSNQR